MSQTPISSREAAPGRGHNHPPEPLDPIEVLDMRLSRTHREMVVRFVDLELGCARVPNPLESEADAARPKQLINGKRNISSRRAGSSMVFSSAAARS